MSHKRAPRKGVLRYISDFRFRGWFFSFSPSPVQLGVQPGENFLALRVRNVTARYRVTVYFESRISRWYLIDSPNAIEKNSSDISSRARHLEANCKFRISRNIFSRDPLASNTRRYSMAKTHNDSRESESCSEIASQASGASWDSREIDSWSVVKYT